MRILFYSGWIVSCYYHKKIVMDAEVLKAGCGLIVICLTRYSDVDPFDLKNAYFHIYQLRKNWLRCFLFSFLLMKNEGDSCSFRFFFIIFDIQSNCPLNILTF